MRKYYGLNPVQAAFKIRKLNVGHEEKKICVWLY